MFKTKSIAILTATTLLSVVLSGCTQADRVRHNVQKEANYFNVERRLTVINARTDKPLLEMTGTFSISNNSSNELVVTV